MLDLREVKISNNANGIYLKRFMIKEKNDKVISPKKAIGKCPNRKVKRTVIKKLCTLQISKYIKICYALQEIQYLFLRIPYIRY
jgi:hypothetical protein